MKNAPRQLPSRRATLIGKTLSKLVAITAALFRRVGFGRKRVAAEPSEHPQLVHVRARLFRCAIQLLDDAAGAEQVVNQALRQAAAGGHSLTDGRPDAAGSSSPRPESDWLLRQVVSLSVQRLKALSILPVLPPIPAAAMGEAAEPAPAEASESGGATKSSEQQRRERLTRALLKLPVEMRVTLILVLMQGRSVGEAASLLGCQKVTCAFWLSHGRKQLRRALQRDLAPGTDSGGLLRVLVSPETPYDLRGNKKAIARA